MTKHTLISAYTPSNMAPQLREDIFVQRHKLLAKTVQWLTASVTSDDKHHLLFVGPRGCGKTLMVSMAEYRLSQTSEIQDDLRIVWLGEDDVITGFIDLALAILNALTDRYPDEFTNENRAKAAGMAPDDAADIILNGIIEQAKNKTILLIIENLDLAFRGLQDSGQKKWRAFLQETRQITTLATSQQLFNGVSSRDAAFFGFFDIHHLAPLTFEDAALLMQNIAREHNKTDLVNFIGSATGRYRVRALHHLAGGNHRLYIELSAFLTIDSLDGLVQALEGLADELTPFFQERVKSLPPQQARIVQWLCDYGGAASVKAIAQDTFIKDSNVSKQLSELKKKCYVISQKRGKETYFELAEPLMRLAMETKNQRGKPLRLIVSFLKVWFSDRGVGDVAADGSLNEFMQQRLGDYRQAMVDMDDDFSEDVNRGISEEVRKCIANEAWDDARALAEELIAADSVIGYLAMVKVYSHEGKHRSAIDTLSTVVNNIGNYNKQKVFTSAIRTLVLFLLAELRWIHDTLSDAKTVLKKAFEEGDKNMSTYGVCNIQIIEINQSNTWSEIIKWLIPLYTKHGCLDKLSAVLILSIKQLADVEFPPKLVKKWNSTWQQQGAEVEELSLALTTLDAATTAILDGSDRPLFKLPKEIRELVLPLLGDIFER